MGTRTHDRRRWRLPVWAALAAYLVVALLPFDDLVVCVRADGHADLEVADASGCLDCGASGPSSGEEHGGCCSRSPDGCGDAPCHDIVVLQHQDEPGLLPAKLVLPGAALVAGPCEFPAVVSWSPDCAIPRARPPAPPRAPPPELARVLRL